MASSVSETPVTRGNGNDADTAITLGVLHAVHTDSSVTQRRLAGDLGIALGLTNAYLRRCVRKGLVKVRQAPPNRYLYYLTPKGFAEKSRLTGEYLSNSFSFFRNARSQCTRALDVAAARGWHRIALYGASELAEVVSLCEAPDVEIVTIIDPTHRHSEFAHLPVVATIADAGAFDAILLTALKDPQTAYYIVLASISAERVLVPALLRVAQTPTPQPGD